MQKYGQMSPSVIQLSLAEEQDPLAAIRVPMKLMSSSDERYRCEAAEGRLRSRCCGLLEAQEHRSKSRAQHHPLRATSSNTERHVGFLHKTAEEFLQSEHVWDEILSWTAASAFNPDLALLSSLVYEIRVHFPKTPNFKAIDERIRLALTYAALAQSSSDLSHTTLLDGLDASVQHLWPDLRRGIEISLAINTVQPLWNFKSQCLTRSHWTVGALVSDNAHKAVYKSADVSFAENDASNSDDCAREQWMNPFLSLTVSAGLFKYPEGKIKRFSFCKKNSFLLQVLLDYLQTRSSKLKDNQSTAVKIVLNHGADPMAAFTGPQSMVDKKLRMLYGDRPGTAMDSVGDRTAWAWLLQHAYFVSEKISEPRFRFVGAINEAKPCIKLLDDFIRAGASLDTTVSTIRSRKTVTWYTQYSVLAIIYQIFCSCLSFHQLCREEQTNEEWRAFSQDAMAASEALRRLAKKLEELGARSWRLDPYGMWWETPLRTFEDEYRVNSPILAHDRYMKKEESEEESGRKKRRIGLLTASGSSVDTAIENA